MKYKLNALLKTTNIFAFVTILLILWLVFAKIDVLAQAPGKIIPSGKIKTINVVQTSIIHEVKVKDGQFVQQGQILAVLDSVDPQSDVKILQHDLSLNQMKLRMVSSQINKTPFLKLPQENDEIYAEVKSEMNAKLSFQNSSMMEAQLEIDKGKSQLLGNHIQLVKLKDEEVSWKKQIETYRELSKSNYVSSIAADEKIRQANESLKAIEIAKQEIVTTQTLIAQAQSKKQKIQDDYISQLWQQKTQLLSDIAKLKENLEKSEHKLSLMQLKAPASGFVKDIITHSKGTVLTEGQVLMSIVPDKEQLVAEVMLKNDDIGYIQVGQKVKLKVNTFPFQKFGVLNGKVNMISADSTEDKEKNLSYRILVQIDKDFVGNNPLHKIKEGMQLQADVLLYKRTVLEYLISPLQKMADEAATQR